VGRVTEDSVRPLGEWLRQSREELGFSLEEAQDATRIRARFLEALESEDLAALPNPVVARGFLRNYAAYLGLDPQEAADRFLRVAGPAQPEVLAPQETPPPTGEMFHPVVLHEQRVKNLRGWLLAALLIVLVVGTGLLIWRGYPTVSHWVNSAITGIQTARGGRATAAPVEIVTHTPTTTSTRSLMPATATLTRATPTLELTLSPTITPSLSPTPSMPVYTGIFLELVFSDTSWIQVSTDGVRQFQGELTAGTYRSWYAEERIELRAGNAGVVTATINGQNLGTLGAPGEVVDRAFEKMDNQVFEVTATPEITGTVITEPAEGGQTPETTPIAPAVPPPSATPTLTATLTPTLTPTLTSAPTLSLTATASP
jgi:cytoskeletal protein RodZ